MKISNVQNYAFGARKYRRPQINYDNFNYETDKIDIKRKPTKFEKAILYSSYGFLLLSLGYSLGGKNAFKEGYNAAMNEVSNNPQISEQVNAEGSLPIKISDNDEIPEITVAPSVTPFNDDADVLDDEFVVSDVDDTYNRDDINMDRINQLAEGETPYEVDLSTAPYLYRDEFGVPSYLQDTGIDENKLSSAQENVARLFKAGDYIIVSPKQDTTMGVLKDVFGIIDGVVGDDALNLLNERELIEGSNGNLDDAIIPAGDAIRVKRFDSATGHQIGAYEYHKSNKSREKIANTILEYAD